MDRLDQLTVFLAILDGGSLAAAGRRLHRSPPAVSRILGDLEERIGVRLLERTTRRLAATEAGRRLALQARRLLADYDQAVGAEDQNQLRGLLRLTAPLMFGRRHVTPLVADFLKQHPQVRAEVILNDRNLDLIEDGLDLGVRIGWQEDSTLVVRKVGHVRRLLVASPDYLDAKGRPGLPDDLASHDMIFSTGRQPPVEWHFTLGGKDHIVRVVPRLQISDVEATLVVLRSGGGIGTVLSYQVAEELADGRLERVLAAFEPPPVPVQLVVPSNHLLPAKTRAFLDHAAAGLSGLAVLRPQG